MVTFAASSNRVTSKRTEINSKVASEEGDRIEVVSSSAASSDLIKSIKEEVPIRSAKEIEEKKMAMAHLKYADLHGFSTLVLSEGFHGAVEHRIAHDHLSGFEMKAIKKFVYRDGAPNKLARDMEPPVSFMATKKNQYSENQKRLAKVTSQVGVIIRKPIGMSDDIKQYNELKEKMKKEKGGATSAMDIMIEDRSKAIGREIEDTTFIEGQKKTLNSSMDDLDLQLGEEEDEKNNMGAFGAGLRSPHHLLKGIV